jgi:hypothetical protein
MIELLVKEKAITAEAQYPNISTPDNSKFSSIIGLSILHFISLTTVNGLRIMIEPSIFITCQLREAPAICDNTTIEYFALGQSCQHRKLMVF